MIYNIMETSQRIKAVRLENKYTQVVMAEILGIHVNTYQKIEHGKLGVSIDMALSMSEEFQLSLDYLYKGSELDQNKRFEEITKNKSENEINTALNMLESILEHL